MSFGSTQVDSETILASRPPLLLHLCQQLHVGKGLATRLLCTGVLVAGMLMDCCLEFLCFFVCTCVYSGTAKLEDAADLFVRAANSFKVAKRNKGGL